MKPLETIAYVANHRFLVADGAALNSWPGKFSNNPGEEGLGLSSGIVAVQCPRQAGPAAVFLEVHSRKPEVRGNRYCKVLEASIQISTGILRILGEKNTEGHPGLDFPLRKGLYSLRISYSDLDTVSFGEENGAEHYWLDIFPGDSTIDPSSDDYNSIRPYEDLESAVTEPIEPLDVEELHWLAQHRSPSVRCNCAVALARQKQFKAVQHLALNDSSRGVRMVAVGALAMMEARTFLEMVSDRERGLIGETARRHLDKMDGE